MTDKSKQGRRNRQKGNEYENRLTFLPGAKKVSVPGKKRDDLRIELPELSLSVESKNVDTPLSQAKMLAYGEERSNGLPVIGITHIQGGNLANDMVVMRVHTLNAILKLAAAQWHKWNKETSRNGLDYLTHDGVLLWPDDDGVVIVPNVGEAKLTINVSRSGTLTVNGE